ncbi:hypothetical protein [Novosphingobium jiangmenense]|uniref:DUF2946 domain-containing protein n=1 Tax=Novosphingobium jiangmenense TaxID=2791981 RepID=A0ABS0HLH7_9SPHN|nr:hypothetical protein [Novosphingobium jiangmenense]MBF9153094.1 hypothetical protein [Novosphingobium jiangmenense]
MRELLIRIAIIFSVFMAGMHFPAEAAQPRIQGDVEAYTCIEDGTADAAGQHSSKPDDQAGEAAHHHHGPMAMDLHLKAAASDLAPTPSLHFPASPAALTSRNPVPPLDPPLA